MRWEPVNAMIYESATHRVRLVGNRWFAERKARGDEPATKIGNGFEWQVDAERACEADERQRRC